MNFIRHFKMSEWYTIISSSIFFILIPYNNGLSRIDPLVDTKLGLIRGLRASDGDYAMFMGIPYGVVNGSNPFGAPIPQSRFNEVFEAYDDSAVCPQIDEFSGAVAGNIDCLHLNIYVPSTASSRNRLPVLVWIYGGRFQFGASGRYRFGPKFIVRHDIILVTLNYRVGPYGFMCLDSPEVSGNQGLKDQQLALKWIKENIKEFGGDDTKITISGESAGAMSVDFHLIFEKEKLFDKVIIQSGTTLTATFDVPVTNAPILIAKNLGFETDDINEAIEFLSNVDTDLVIATVADLDLEFWPCVEKEYDGVERFATENWISAEERNVRNMPVLIGFNDNEQLGHANGDSEYFENLDTVERQLFNRFDVDDEEFNGMEDIVKHFYFGDEGVSVNTKWKVIDFDSDFHFNHPTMRSIDKFITSGAGNIYFYVFSYAGERNLEKKNSNITVGGAAHADDLGYIFDVSFMPEDPNVDDQRVIDRMTTMWANFVKYGDPTPETSELLPVKWTPNTLGSPRHYMNISEELSMATRPFNDRMAFWDLFFRANSNLERLYPGNNVIVH